MPIDRLRYGVERPINLTRDQAADIEDRLQQLALALACDSDISCAERSDTQASARSWHPSAIGKLIVCEREYETLTPKLDGMAYFGTRTIARPDQLERSHLLELSEVKRTLTGAAIVRTVHVGNTQFETFEHGEEPQILADTYAAITVQSDTVPLHRLGRYIQKIEPHTPADIAHIISLSKDRFNPADTST